MVTTLRVATSELFSGWIHLGLRTDAGMARVGFEYPFLNSTTFFWKKRNLYYTLAKKLTNACNPVTCPLPLFILFL